MMESTCSHENTRHDATTNDRYCHDCKCIIEVAGTSVVPIPVEEYQARQAANAPTDLERVKQELSLKRDTHIGHVLMEIERLKSALECERERVSELERASVTRAKSYAHYLGAPEFYELDQACRTIHEAFDAAEFSGVYLVGSSLKRPDYRDVDVRCILDDVTFRVLFPGASTTGGDWMRHAGWALHCSAMSVWLAQRTRLKIDFQFQSMTGANELYDGPEHPRNALGHGITNGRRAHVNKP